MILSIFTLFAAQGFLSLDALSLYQRKFKDSASQQFHIQKSLVYFGDAESGPMPRMLAPADWEEVKEYFVGEVEN